ncbi:MAG: glycosyltransferase [Phycisphaerales bacterium]|nr:glycosyltransferase [Planctomycetota bacterium]MBL6997708.1 glycosyltransferase [Phycisphaerales bacterium]
MKLLHYFPSTRFTEGGTVRAAIDFCSVLARRGHDVTWLTCDDYDVPQSWKDKEPNTPTIKLLGPLQKTGKRLTKQQISKAAEVAKEMDVTHIHAMWMPSNPQMAKACDSVGTPWVLSTHGMLDDWCMEQRPLKKKLYLSTVGRIMLRGANTFLTTAEAEKSQSEKWLKHENIAVIPYIVDLDPYQDVPSPQEAIDKYGVVDEPTVLFLSRVHEKKSIETLIDATAILNERGYPIRVFIAGTGEDTYIKSLQDRASAAGVSKLVTFLGMVVGDLKLSLYAMADIFALPTQQENFGLVYTEAMLCETPAIGTKGTDIWKELEEGGAVIADRTPQAFADAIQTLTSDKELLKVKGVEGRKRILKWLDTETVASKYENMYQSASSGHQL